MIKRDSNQKFDHFRIATSLSMTECYYIAGHRETAPSSITASSYKFRGADDILRLYLIELGFQQNNLHELQKSVGSFKETDF